MIDTLRSYLNKEDYYIIIMNDKIYIKNYTKLISITDTEIYLNFKKENIKIVGHNFYLAQSNNKELIIKGILESIKKYDNN